MSNQFKIKTISSPALLGLSKWSGIFNIDKNGKFVVKYYYNAWGNTITEVLDQAAYTIASLNPFRYRSYYYDEEIAKYYLQSRYYDPVFGRFINGDETLVDLFLNMSLSYAILRAIYEFIPASRKFLIL